MTEQHTGFSDAQIQELFRLHDAAKERLQAKLALRTPARIKYDDYLLGQMRKGKPFKIAHRKANSKFPAEALTVSGEEFAELEDHYQTVLGIEQMDQHRRRVEYCNAQIQAAKQKTAEVLEEIASNPEQPPPTKI